MLDIRKCYEILGVPQGASKEQVKQAYHDLVKVWHPDRFAHDVRLQQRAQEKLKEINEAFDAITSPPAFKTQPRPRPAQPTAPATHDEYKAPKDKQSARMPIVSFLVLLLAIVLFAYTMYFFQQSFFNPVDDSISLKASV